MNKAMFPFLLIYSEEKNRVRGGFFISVTGDRFKGNDSVIFNLLGKRQLLIHIGAIHLYN